MKNISTPISLSITHESSKPLSLRQVSRLKWASDELIHLTYLTVGFS